MLHTEGKDWRKELNIVLLLYKISLHCTTKIAPATVLFNQEINNGIPQLPKATSHDKELMKEMRRTN